MPDVDTETCAMPSLVVSQGTCTEAATDAPLVTKDSGGIVFITNTEDRAISTTSESCVGVTTG